MRYLFTSFPGASVTFPLIPLAQAAQAAGHDVLFASCGPGLPTATGAGLLAVAVDPDGDAQRANDRIQALTTASGSDAAFKDMTVLFGEVGTGMAEGLVDAGRTWGADAVVYTPGHVAGLFTARVLGVPAVLQGSGVPRPTFREGLEQMLPLARKMGVDELPEADLYIDVSPPSLTPVVDSLPKRGMTDPSDDWGGSTPTLPMRFCSYAGGAELPAWALERGPRPRVLTTAGVVPDAFFGEGGLVREIIRGTEGLGVELVVTVADAERSALPSPLPEHVTLVDWVPLRALLATCDAIVHHGGMSTTYSSFAAAVPQLVVPAIADAAVTTHMVVASGAGTTLELAATDATTVAAAVGDLLAEPRYREVGERLAAEMRTMPEPSTVIGQVTEAVGPVAART